MTQEMCLARESLDVNFHFGGEWARRWRGAGGEARERGAALVHNTKMRIINKEIYNH